MGLNRYVIWLHDYGSQFRLRLAIAKPDRIAGLVIQNGDIYDDAFGPEYDFLKKSWETPALTRADVSPSTSPSEASNPNSETNCPTRLPAASAQTCGRCTGR